jgi:hypothetical protein
MMTNEDESVGHTPFVRSQEIISPIHEKLVLPVATRGVLKDKWMEATFTRRITHLLFQRLCLAPHIYLLCAVSCREAGHPLTT